ncbi:RNA-binding protein pop5 [Friedmanniomyces endolithicus]|uniref:Ribonuclease P/MRP protein subunit POP5 n=1 Tax=Friedmanniomyces endolithicus TaxID=329885 RepID=A0AAN6KI69_9PEZI|nr:RNA-binding protein pop5 [Friedmanniomyces endolithicus]KAK0983980.1 RNA-binding protein pop5 [Friedmanniomyces endolithicus]KAK1008855.1 RNA-binding protein pop5 [Friedmanniomyces endolithicus]KAK1048549.1 RNA-binding protein pop5 [Friedmanniomyces endolithicus]
MVRIKHRYLLVNILYPDAKYSPLRPAATAGDDIPYTVQFRRPSPDQMNGGLLMRLIRDGVVELFGDYGSGKIAGSLQVKYFSSATSTAIIRVSREHYRLVWSALTLTTRLPRPVDQPCVIQVVRVSGTIRKAEEEAIRRARLSIRRAEAAAKSSSVSIAGTIPTASTAAAAGDDDFDMINGIEDPDELGDLDDDDDG